MKIFIILLFYNLDDNCAKIVLIGDRIVATGAGSSWNTDRYFRKLTRHSSIFHRKHGRWPTVQELLALWSKKIRLTLPPPATPDDEYTLFIAGLFDGVSAPIPIQYKIQLI